MPRPSTPKPRPGLAIPEVPEIVAELRRWRQDLQAQMTYFQRMDRWFCDLQARLSYPDPTPRPLIHGPDLDTFEARLHAVEEVLAQLATNAARLIKAQELLTTGVADQAASAQVEAVRLHAHLDELMAVAERSRLESHGCVVQANAALRELGEQLDKEPALVANAVAVAVGSVLSIPAATGDLPGGPAVYLIPERNGPAEEDLAA